MRSKLVKIKRSILVNFILTLSKSPIVLRMINQRRSAVYKFYSINVLINNLQSLNNIQIVLTLIYDRINNNLFFILVDFKKISGPFLVSTPDSLVVLKQDI